MNDQVTFTYGDPITIGRRSELNTDWRCSVPDCDFAIACVHSQPDHETRCKHVRSLEDHYTNRHLPLPELIQVRLNAEIDKLIHTIEGDDWPGVYCRWYVPVGGPYYEAVTEEFVSTLRQLLPDRNVVAGDDLPAYADIGRKGSRRV